MDAATETQPNKLCKKTTTKKALCLVGLLLTHTADTNKIFLVINHTCENTHSSHLIICSVLFLQNCQIMLFLATRLSVHTTMSTCCKVKKRSSATFTSPLIFSTAKVLKSGKPEEPSTLNCVLRTCSLLKV